MRRRSRYAISGLSLNGVHWGNRNKNVYMDPPPIECPSLPLKWKSFLRARGNHLHSDRVTRNGCSLPASVSSGQYPYSFHLTLADSGRNKSISAAELRCLELDLPSTSARKLFRYKEAELKIRIGMCTAMHAQIRVEPNRSFSEHREAPNKTPPLTH